MRLLKDEINAEDFYHIGRVIRLIDKITTLFEYNQLDIPLTKRLLSRPLSNWYYVYLKRYYSLEQNNELKWRPIIWTVEALEKGGLLIENEETRAHAKAIFEHKSKLGDLDGVE